MTNSIFYQLANIVQQVEKSEEGDSSFKSLFDQNTGMFDDDSKSSKTSIEETIQHVFELPQVEQFHGEFGCWMMKNVLLKGSLFLTAGHLGFFANLNQEPDRVAIEGFLVKRGKSKQYYRYWFVLRGHVLSYYENAKDVYFPLGSIDLRKVISVQFSQKCETKFKIITPTKKHCFKAETRTSTVEWKKVIETAVFKAVNGGDSIKIVIPLANLTDASLVHSQVLGDAIMLKTTDVESAVALSIGSPSSISSGSTFDHPSDEEYYFANFRDAKSVFDLIVHLKEKHQSTLVAQEENITASMEFLDISPNVISSSEAVPQERQRHWGFGRLRSPPSYEQPTTVEQLAKYFPGYINAKETRILDTAQAYLLTENGYVPRFGRIYITEHHMFFISRLVGIRTRAVFPVCDIDSIKKVEKSYGFWYGLNIKFKNGEHWLEFRSSEARRRTLQLLEYLTEKRKIQTGKQPAYEDSANRLSSSVPSKAPGALDLNLRLDRSYRRSSITLLLDEIHKNDALFESAGVLSPHALPITSPMFPPVAFEADENTVALETKFKLACLTIGTRGDVQPFIALCKRFMAKGHKCMIATHSEYQEWVESHGIEFKPVSGNPADLMQLCVDNGMFSISFLYEAASKFRKWIDELLVTAYEALKDSDIDVLIESPVAMAGYHIAEKLRVPYLTSFPMPWTKTRDFPHPFAITDYNLGGSYNWMTWTMMETVLWRGIQPQINRFRKKTLNLPALSYGAWLDTEQIPFLYCFSNTVVNKPEDWRSWIHLPGYWFLDSPENDWTPTEALQAFLNYESPKPIVYIGFGSIIVPDPEALTRTIVEAVRRAGVRAVISKGWSSRGQKAKPASEMQNTDEVCFLSSVPHDWLFPRVQAVVHHGGAGTTAAGLRFGCPTVIKPFFGDQYFWASRVAHLNVGVSLKKLEVDSLADAIKKVTTDHKIKINAQVVGEKIRAEDGTENAYNLITKQFHVLREQIHAKKAVAHKTHSAQSSISLKSPMDSAINLNSQAEDEFSLCDPIKGREIQTIQFNKRDNLEGYLSDSNVNYSGSPEEARRGRKSKSKRIIRKYWSRASMVSDDDPSSSDVSPDHVGSWRIPPFRRNNVQTCQSSLTALVDVPAAKEPEFIELQPMSKKRPPLMGHRSRKSDGAIGLSQSPPKRSPGIFSRWKDE